MAEQIEDKNAAQIPSDSARNSGKSIPGRRWIMLILILCLALRFGMLFLSSPWSHPVKAQLDLCNDSPLYHLLACNLLDGKGFASDGIGGPPSLHPLPVNGKPDDFRTPVYPLFVAAVYGVFGRVPWAVSVIQILLNTLTCLLLFSAMRRLFGPRIAAYTALFFAVDPFMILYASFLLSEILFVFLIVLGFYLYVLRVHDRSESATLSSFAMLGALLGLLTLTRPVAQYLPVAVAVLLFFMLRAKPRAAFTAVAIFLASFLIVIAPWLIRNQHYFGVPKLTYIGSWDLLALDAGMVEAAKTGQNIDTVIPKLLSEADTMMLRSGLNPRYMTNLQKSGYWERLAVNYALHDPVRFGVQYIKGAVFGFINLGTSDFAEAIGASHFSMGDYMIHSGGTATAFFSRKSPAELSFGLVTALLLLITYAFAVVGLVSGWRSMDRRVWWLCLVIILYFVAVTGSFGLARLKLPIVPFYLVFAGVGCERALSWWRSRRAT